MRTGAWPSTDFCKPSKRAPIPAPMRLCPLPRPVGRRAASQSGRNDAALGGSGSGGRGPTDPRQRASQRRTSDAEVVTHCRLAGICVERCGERLDLLYVDHRRLATLLPSAFRHGKSGHHPLAGQSALVLRQLTETALMCRALVRAPPLVEPGYAPPATRDPQPYRAANGRACRPI